MTNADVVVDFSSEGNHPANHSRAAVDDFNSAGILEGNHDRIQQRVVVTERGGFGDGTAYNETQQRKN